MAINQISFGGQVLPCQIERYPAIRKATRKFRQYNLPGRNGDLFFQTDAYENVIQPYEVWVGDDKYGAQMDWTEFAKYLYKDGYQILKDTYDPDHFRKAVFNGPLDVENSWNTHGRTTIEFNCRPERFRNDGMESIHYIASATDSYYTLSASSIYSGVSSYFRSHGYDSEILYAFDFPSSGPVGTMAAVTSVAGINSIPFAIMKTSGDPTLNTGWELDGAMSGEINTNGQATVSYYDGWANGKTLVVPSNAFKGIPYVIYSHGTPLDRRMIGGPVELKNPYMPCHPDIILECTTAHAGELCAAIIDNYGIYITDADLTTPFYFVNTETLMLTKAVTKTGTRYYADNIRVDAGIQLKSGSNQIFTSALYEMDIVPNWWEL